MKYLAVLGRERELSLAELESVAGTVTPFGECALLEQKPELGGLGGTLKLAKVIAQGQWPGWDKLEIDPNLLRLPVGKIVFGLSFYGATKLSGGAKPWALGLKKKLRRTGVRAVAERSPLSAAQLKFNQILSKGFELVIAVDGKSVVLALTEQYQDIDWYSRRDYDRPNRSAKVGMLPPKLAQIMINLAGAAKVYDPFCGTGVVLQEALLIGKPAAGSDIEAKMIEYSTNNLVWLGREVNRKLPGYSLTVADARTVKLPLGYSVVSEGYLGPPFVNPPSAEGLAKLRRELAQLYSDCLTGWHGQLTKGQRICLAVPCWQIKGNFEILPLIDQIGEIGYDLVRFKNADSGQLIYARPDQIVGRQLLVLERK